LLLAINFYCKTTFGKMHSRDPEIVDLAGRLGRSPGALSYKLANFSSIDPTLDRRGACNVSKLDRTVWEEFFADWDGMMAESERRMAQLMGRKTDEMPADEPACGGDTMRQTAGMARLTQHVFRKMVLSAYGGSCCITGIDHPELLVASHIIPWAQDEGKRLNPTNGLCLNALHDRAFDRGLISVDADYRVMVCRGLDHELIRRYKGQRITLPQRFLPDPGFLEFHRTQVFVDA